MSKSTVTEGAETKLIIEIIFPFGQVHLQCSFMAFDHLLADILWLHFYTASTLEMIVQAIK